MTMNRVQFQPGLSMAEFMDRYGSDDKCEAALIDVALAAGFACPACGCGRAARVRARRAALLPVRRLPPPVQRHQRHDLRGHQAGAVALVPGHAPADPVQEQRRGARTHAPPGGLLQDRLADQAQAHGGHARARGRAASSTAGWRSTTPTSAASARAARPGAARRTRCRSSPRCRPRPTASRSSCACVSSRSPSEEVAMFAARSIAPSATVVSDGLWCFRAVQDRRGRPRARGHRRRQGQHEAAAVQGDQHVPGQPQERPEWHLSRLRLRQVRPSLPRRGPVPIQSAVQHVQHPASIAESLGGRARLAGAQPAAC